MSGTGESVLSEEARLALVAAFQPHVDVPGAWVDRVAPTVAALVAQARADGATEERERSATIAAERDRWRERAEAAEEDAWLS